jgi:hypothetical protein
MDELSLDERFLLRKDGLLNQSGLYALYLLLILNPFHYLLYDKIVYYREFFAIFFSLLCCFNFFSNKNRALEKLHTMKQEIFYIFLFVLLLALYAIIFPGRDLYNSDITGASLQLKTISPSLYVLRNALVYLPMVLYFALRGFTANEIKRMALLILLIAPFSIIEFLNHYEIATLQTLGSLIMMGGSHLQYNSYVPYLTFPALCAIYILAARNVNSAMKLIAFSILVLLSVYILLTTSRQSVLFVLICGFVFLVMSKESRLMVKIAIASTYLVCTVLLLQCITYDHVPHEVNKGRYTTVQGAFKTSRLEFAKQGLLLLKPHEFITGAGLTSVINSGPHNDFIRWTQRVGLIIMIIGFFPFFYIARTAYKCLFYFKNDTITIYKKNNALILYVFLSSLFILYHSIFGYPREDAYQALYCFLSLAMWLGLRNDIIWSAIKLEDRKEIA